MPSVRQHDPDAVAPKLHRPLVIVYIYSPRLLALLSSEGGVDGGALLQQADQASIQAPQLHGQVETDAQNHTTVVVLVLGVNVEPATSVASRVKIGVDGLELCGNVRADPWRLITTASLPFPARRFAPRGGASLDHSVRNLPRPSVGVPTLVTMMLVVVMVLRIFMVVVLAVPVVFVPELRHRH